MKIANAERRGAELVIKAPAADIIKFLVKFKPGEYEIKKSKKKRSLDANGYCWMLCTKIAAAVGATKEEVYRQAITDGNQYAPMSLHPDAVEAFSRVWGSKGIGWTIQVMDDAPNGNKLVFAYYGSSAYDTKQMSELIDRLVQDAKDLDIETLSERELSLLKEGWNG